MRTKARTRTRRNSLRRFLTLSLALLLAAGSCSSEAPRVQKTDVEDGGRLARRAGAILLQLAAYDHAVVGGVRGEKVRAITPERYATVARGIVRDITALASDTVVAAADRAGPIRDRALPLADALTVLGRDIGTYADGGEPGALARVLAAVPGGWQRLIELMAALPPDPELAATVARGRSFEATARVDRLFVLTVGPFSSQAEAEEAARRIGQVESVARSSPFTIRVGTFPDRGAANAGAASLATKGFPTSAVAEEERVTFARGATAPDVELWREPARVFDTAGAARRVGISPDGAWLATGSDDGTVAIFSAQGVLRALPRFNAGIAHLVFSDDGAWLFAGGLTLANIRVPTGQVFGTNVRLPNAAAQAVFVPVARAFAASSRGPTGEASGGPGAIVGRAPDGVTLGSPFPLTTPAGGSVLAPSNLGELYIATPASGGGVDIEVFRVGREQSVRPVVRLPGTLRLLVIDPAGVRAAALTDAGVIRFGPRDGDPQGTVSSLGLPARDVAFGTDGTLYVLQESALIAIDPSGTRRWTVNLVDGRRVLAGKRAIVLDGTERLIAVDPLTGTVDELGVGGTIQDLAVSPDGTKVAVLADARRAVTFTLP